MISEDNTVFDNSKAIMEDLQIQYNNLLKEHNAYKNITASKLRLISNELREAKDQVRVIALLNAKSISVEDRIAEAKIICRYLMGK